MSLIGQTLGQYKILEEIGAGGMATVYKAYQPGLDRHVAIKVLPAQHALTPGFKERFVREAKAVAQLSHPNILSIHDVGLEGDLSYFVMKYVAGGRTLRHLLGQPLDLPTVSNYISQIAGALDHAHARGVLHRDVKPDNMLLEGEWLLLADFGLAKIRASGEGLTGTGMIVGTPAYVPPEQVKGQASDQRADIYSLGVVLYEMVTGRVPFQAETSIATMFQHVHQAPPSPRRYRPDLPEPIEQIILKALAKAPRDRYERAGQLAEELYSSVMMGYSSSTDAPGLGQTRRLFICYKRDIEPDQHLANFLYHFLTRRGHQVFIDRTMRTGEEWLKEIDRQIQASDYLVVLLSKASANSEMVQAEVKRAYEHRKRQGQPHTLPVRVNYEELLPYSIDAFLDQLQYVAWQGEADNQRVAAEIEAAIRGRLEPPHPVVPLASNQFSEDGGALLDSHSLSPPLPEFDPRVLEALEAPGGVVKLRDKFYVERQADHHLRREIARPGTTSTIRASRQTGKSSLLVRGINHARQQGTQVVMVDLQRIDSERLTSPDIFLRDLAELIVRKLRLDAAEVEKLWGGTLGPQDKLTYLLEDYVLPELESPLVLALDEVDRLLQVPFHTDFFGLLRSWHNSRALDEQWDKLNLVLVISTEPYLLIGDVNQSPFNVGLKIYLEDFNAAQMRDLNQRHGAPVPEAEFDHWCALLGGQPYLTRKALFTMVSERLTWSELTRQAPLDQGPFGDHLRRQQWLLKDEPDLREAFKQIIEQGHCADEMALFRLLQAGLVKGSGEVYTCRCELYRLYFRDKLG